jgi:hypothetical protein
VPPTWLSLAEELIERVAKARISPCGLEQGWGAKIGKFAGLDQAANCGLIGAYARCIGFNSSTG